ncbi:TPA: response regulator transcription factor [Candidatus Galligastranaerophilus intestinavium]|uniref:Response regulator transcription factor n=1 Tax=Candidatus Galligastranaerophilus intestinavium TaxID=2840836 RepID=A0A9D1FJB2_9BACT|nr:response regulator transcription factor [Candidatus Galligastranaerophilus intestinavium]
MNENKIKILIVEDHMVARMGIAIIVENTPNFELVGQAQDGQEGVSLALHLKPDVILMDIGLPKIDGIEATRKIKEAKLNSSILMFTSRDSSDDIFAALRAGADGYIMKGSDEKTLKNAIEAVNQKAGWLDPQIARVVLSSINEQKENTQDKTKSLNNKYGLTKKELEVLSLIVDGLSNQEIAQKLVVSLSTTKAHVHSILQKLYLTDRTKAAITALKEGLV